MKQKIVSGFRVQLAGVRSRGERYANLRELGQIFVSSEKEVDAIAIQLRKLGVRVPVGESAIMVEQIELRAKRVKGYLRNGRRVRGYYRSPFKKNQKKEVAARIRKLKMRLRKRKRA